MSVMSDAVSEVAAALRDRDARGLLSRPWYMRRVSIACSYATFNVCQPYDALQEPRNTKDGPVTDL